MDQCNDQDRQIRDAPSIFAFQSVNQNNDKVNNYLCNHIRDLSDVDCYDPTDNNDYDIIYEANISDENLGLMFDSSIELNSNDNMPVVGALAYIITNIEETDDVNAYSPEYEFRKIKIGDATLQYEIPHDIKISILVLRNALYVPSMEKKNDTTLHHERG